MNSFTEAVELVVFGIGALIVGMIIAFAVVYALFYLFGGLYRLIMFISGRLKKKLCKGETEKPFEELTDEERRKDSRYLAPYMHNNQSASEVDEEPLCIIFRIKDDKYISAGWKADINGKLYGDWIPMNENYHNSEEFLKVAIQILINSYTAVKENLERNDE